MEQTDAGRVQDLLSHPFVSLRPQDPNPNTLNEHKVSYTSIFPHADDIHHDTRTPNYGQGLSDMTNSQSPMHTNSFSRSSSKVSSPLRTSFLPSSNSSQQTLPSSDASYSGHYHQHGASPSLLAQCPNACESHRHSSTQFLIAHGRSPIGGDTGPPSVHTQYEATESYASSKQFHLDCPPNFGIVH
jgi:hypothetical protein